MAFPLAKETRSQTSDMEASSCRMWSPAQAAQAARGLALPEAKQARCPALSSWEGQAMCLSRLKTSVCPHVCLHVPACVPVCVPVRVCVCVPVHPSVWPCVCAERVLTVLTEFVSSRGRLSSFCVWHHVSPGSPGKGGLRGSLTQRGPASLRRWRSHVWAPCLAPRVRGARPAIKPRNGWS